MFKITKNGFRMKNLLLFWCQRFCRFFIYREVKSLPSWFYPHLVLFGVYVHEEIELVVTFKTSPSSSKTDSVCKRYYVFRISGFLVLQSGFKPRIYRVSYRVHPELIPGLNRASPGTARYAPRNPYRIHPAPSPVHTGIHTG